MTSVLAASVPLLMLTLGYATVCGASPFGNCRKCRGLGFQLTYTRQGKPKRGKHCRRCDGIGKRIRVGRHLYNVAARIHRDGTR
ncbi:hypothetical protein OG735_20815 [Streptomyces sp. NBC_01210]|uniref:hypothetical protein n=1 Tax=Streptomyces sp. NBC_01210 TaxID=2903774 RepID=UPI002E0F7BF5|nr:hypothetical protein OG735_20815 [Streptomyces sp. NBC_01210]